MRPSAAAAAQRTLQCSSSSATRRAAAACGSPISPRPSAAARRRLRSASRRTSTRGRTAPGARICPRASTAAKRSSLRGSARSGSRCSTASGLRICPRARTAAKRSRGSGSASSGSRSGADVGLAQAPEGEHRLLAHEAALVGEAGAQHLERRRGPRSRRAPASPPRAAPPARPATRPPGRARRRGRAGGRASAPRGRARPRRPRPRACTRSGRTRSALIRESASMALSWMSSLSSPRSSKSSMAASSSPSRPMAAAASARTSVAGSWMSGATSADALGRGDPGQAAHRPEANGVVRVREPALPGRAVPEADGDEGVARELLHGGVAQELEERRARPAASRSQPRVTAAVRRLRGSSSASIPSEVGHEVLAPERGLDLRVEALAGGGRALLDLHHRPDRGVAQGGVGVVEVGDDARRARSRPARPAEGLERGRAKQLVAEEVEERRAPPAGRRSRRGRGWPGTGARARRAAPRRGGARPRATPICPRLVAAAWRTLTSGSRERLERAATAAGSFMRAEHHGGEVADLLVGVGEEGQERRPSRPVPSRT